MLQSTDLPESVESAEEGSAANYRAVTLQDVTIPDGNLYISVRLTVFDIARSSLHVFHIT